MREYQLIHLSLIHRHREQAPSHIFNRIYFKLFSSQAFKSCTSTSLIV